MEKNLKLLTSFWFLVGLSILLLNDFVLKELYGNWLTGKLSDFSGLFIFPLFWTVLFKGHKSKIFWFTALGFVFWKSSVSQLFIEEWNSLGVIYISRVVDYTDLIALSVLPLAYYFESLQNKTYSFRLSPIIPIFISLFAFIATSKHPITCFNEDSGHYDIQHISRDSLINSLIESNLNLTYSKYHNTTYEDEHFEIHNLNDSINNLVFLVKDFDKTNKTVRIELGCWNYVLDSYLDGSDKETLEKHRDYVKSVFEENVISKIELKNP